MGDPTRLLHAESDADELERVLLESLHGASAPARARAEIWRDVSAQLLAGAIVTAAPATVSAVANSSVQVGASSKVVAGLSALLGKATVAKVALVVAIGGAAAGGVAVWPGQHGSPQGGRSGAQRAPARNTPTEPVQALRVVQPPVATRVESAPCEGCREISDEPSHQGARRARPDKLTAESRLLTRARADLRRGDVQAAQRALALLSKNHRFGALVQEREVLNIELLSARGQPDAARKRAQRFAAAHPESPHVATLKRYLAAP